MIELKEDNIEERLKMLEDGVPLYRVIPELDQHAFDNFSMKYGQFKRRKAIEVEGELYLSSQGSFPVGKLIIPYYSVFSREEIENMLKTTDYNHNKVIYQDLLSGYPDADSFYMYGTMYEPLDNNKILILKKGQI